MDIPKLYYLIVTKEEIKVFIEALELCMDTIEYKISLTGFDGCDNRYYLELCSEYDKYETMLTKIKTMMNDYKNK